MLSASTCSAEFATNAVYERSGGVGLRLAADGSSVGPRLCGDGFFKISSKIKSHHEDVLPDSHQTNKIRFWFCR